jgi:thiamine-monophosphate kinase
MATDTPRPHPSISDVGEFGLIRRLKRILPSSPLVVEGVGDDCAVVRLHGRLLLASVDVSIEGVHYDLGVLAPQQAGWKAAAASLSDIAAMGGTPQFALVSLAAPPETPAAVIEQMYQGMVSAMSANGAVIVGGDTATLSERTLIDVVVVGEAPGGRYLSRRGAQPGDLLAVTGRLGLSAAGYHSLSTEGGSEALQIYHWRPHPRVLEAQWLVATDRVHAMIDISDGLLQDAGHLATSSRLGLDVHTGAITIAPELAAYAERHGMDPLADFALGGGEDFELLFALDHEGHEEVFDDFRHQFRTEIAIIGRFTDEWTGVRVDGEERALTGYQHFRRPG